MVEVAGKNDATRKLDRYLGSPSAQKLLQILACWDSLSVKEMAQKTALSESQIHVTLKNLEKIELVVKKGWGRYSLSDSQFAHLLKAAYLNILEQIIGNEIFQIATELDNTPSEELKIYYTSLVDRWEPILVQKYSARMNALAEYFIDADISN